jgi:cytochrome c-type biogenesis protein CcmE
MTRKQRRLALIGSGLGVLAVAVALILGSLRDSIVFFISPSDIAENKAAPGDRVRLGGLVKLGSVERGDDLQVRFDVTDGNKDIREGQGVIAEGHVEPGGTFKADTLAKHDENYMPREVVEILKKQGRWQEGSAKMMPREADPLSRASPQIRYFGKFTSEKDAVGWINAHPRLTKPVAENTIDEPAQSC